MTAFISSSSYATPSTTPNQYFSSAPLAPAPDSVLSKKRGADEADVDQQQQQQQQEHSFQNDGSRPTAPIFKRRMTDATLTGSDGSMQLDGSSASNGMHSFDLLPHHPNSSLNLYGTGETNGSVVSGTIAISPSTASAGNEAFFQAKQQPDRHLGQMANASGTCSPAFSAFSTTDGTSIADGEMPFCFEHDSPDHRDEDEMMPVETHSEADFGGMQQAHYDSYNGGFWEDDAMAGRYVGDGGDQYAARLEGVMGHA